MSNKMDELNFYPVFVDHIAPSVNPGDLRMMFSNFGSVVDVVLVSDYGFVNVADVRGALRCVTNLNGETLHQSRLHVDLSEEMKQYLDTVGQRYVCTRDPWNGYSSKHPPYPVNDNIPSPFPDQIQQNANISENLGFSSSQRSVNPWEQLDRTNRSEDPETSYQARKLWQQDNDRTSKLLEPESYQQGRKPWKHDHTSGPMEFQTSKQARNPWLQQDERTISPIKSETSNQARNPWLQRDDRTIRPMESETSNQARNPWLQQDDRTIRPVEVMKPEMSNMKPWLHRDDHTNRLMEPEISKQAMKPWLHQDDGNNRPMEPGTSYHFPWENPSHKMLESQHCTSPPQNEAQTLQSPWQHPHPRVHDNKLRIPHQNIPGRFASRGHDSSLGWQPPDMEESVEVRLRRINEKLESIDNRSSILKTRSSDHQRSRSRSQRSSRARSRSKLRRNSHARSRSRSSCSRRRVSESSSIISIKSRSHSRSRERRFSSQRSRSKPDITERTIEMVDDDEIESWEVPNERIKDQSMRESSDISNALDDFFETPGAELNETGNGESGDARIDMDSIAKWRAHCLKSYRFSSNKEKLSNGTLITFTYDREKVSDEEIINLCEIKGDDIKKLYRDQATFLQGASQQNIVMKLKPQEAFNQFYWINKMPILVWHLGQDMQCYNCLLNYMYCPSQGNSGKCRKIQPPKCTQKYMQEFHQATGYRSLEEKYSSTGSDEHEYPPPGSDPSNKKIQARNPSNLIQITHTKIRKEKESLSNLKKKKRDECLTDILGTVYSILKDIAIISFYRNVRLCKGQQFAKVTFDQMYIKGRFHMGSQISGKDQEDWPKQLRDLFTIGKKLIVNLEKVSEVETIGDGEDKSVIDWSVQSICTMGHKLYTNQFTFQRRWYKEVVLARVERLFPKWGLVKYQSKVILFSVDKVFWNGGMLKREMCLLKNTDIEVGDVLAVYCGPYAGNPETKAMYGNPETRAMYGNWESVKSEASVLWRVQDEVDPWVQSRVFSWTEAEFEDGITHLYSSNVLSKALPGVEDATHKQIKGCIEEIHFPAGGIIKINADAISPNEQNKDPEEELVYFHRSKVLIKDEYLSSSQNLAEQMIVGDEVIVDIVENEVIDEASGVSTPYVMAKAYWVALKVQAFPDSRGASLAEVMKKVVPNHDKDVSVGHVVYLYPPEAPMGPVIRGFLTINCGKYLGQRFMFDRKVASAFGFPLTSVDMSKIFFKDEDVNVKINTETLSVEKMWIGDRDISEKDDESMVAYLNRHGITCTVLNLREKLLSPSHFVPLERQCFRGKVVKADRDASGMASSVTIRNSSQEDLVVDRCSINVYGHWMDKADVTCLIGDSVNYELIPRFAKEEGSLDVALVWTGDEKDRPTRSQTAISTMMNNIIKIGVVSVDFKSWLAKRKLDADSFKELLDGKNPFDETVLEVDVQEDKEIVQLLDDECEKNSKETHSCNAKDQESRIGDFVKSTRADAEQQRKKKESWSTWAKERGPQHSGIDLYGDLDSFDDDDIVIVDEVDKQRKKASNEISEKVDSILQSFGHKTSAAGSCPIHPTANHSEDWCREEQLKRLRIKKHNKVDTGTSDATTTKPTKKAPSTIQSNPEPDTLVSKIESCSVHPGSGHTAGECNLLLQKMTGVGWPKWEGNKATRKFFVGGLNPAVVDNDLKDLFGRYGRVSQVDMRCGSNEWTAFVNIVATDLEAVKCRCQLNRHFVRGCRMRVEFRKDSYESSKTFRDAWEEEFQKFSGKETKTQCLDVSSVGSGLRNIDVSLSSNQTTTRPWDNFAQLPQFSQFRSERQMFQKAFPPPSTNTNLNVLDAMKQSFRNQSFESSMEPFNQPEFSRGPSNLPELAAKLSRKRTISQISDDSSSLISTKSCSIEPAVPPLPASWSKYERPIQDTDNMFSAYEIGKQSKSNVSKLNSVQGIIHSIDAQCILIEIDTDINKFAQIIPGNMYLDGHVYLANQMKDPIKENKKWPENLQQFLVIGKKLWMDLKTLSDKEKTERKVQGKEICWDVLMAWDEGKRPGMKDLTVNKATMDSRIVIATVVKLFPSWGVLDFENTQIIFRIENLFWEKGLLGENMSLYKNCEIELGDIMAVHCRKSDKTELVDFMCGLPEGVDSVVSNIEYVALLVWQVSAEVDPWLYYRPRKAPSFNYLVTSSTLSKELPGENEANFSFSGRGVVEELQLPAGGIIKLDIKSIPSGLLPSNSERNKQSMAEYVYFHRSRVYVNGSKMKSDDNLNTVVVGDEVQMELVKNHPIAADPPYVMSRAHWVAISVKVNAKKRGKILGQTIRKQFGNTGEEFDLGPNVTTGKIVYLAPPDVPNGPVISGIAVIDSGALLGQGVHFDRSACYAFGTSLERADISYIFNKDDRVYIATDPGNSFCVESLWVGSSNVAYRGLCHNQQEQNMMVRFLNEKNINATRLQALVNGGCPPRPHIPLQRQQFKGKVTKVITDKDGETKGILINGALDETVRADKSVIFMFGHWMGKADISWMADEHVLYELVPRYREDDDDSRQAGLVWVGNSGNRPRYEGCAAKPNITEEMEAHFNDWMEEKSMDMVDGALTKKDAFVYGDNALGRLDNVLRDIEESKESVEVGVNQDKGNSEETDEPAIPSVYSAVSAKEVKEAFNARPSSSGTAPVTADELDEETLAQAAMLQKIKSQMGSKAVTEALMAMMKGGQSATRENKD